MVSIYLDLCGLGIVVMMDNPNFLVNQLMGPDQKEPYLWPVRGSPRCHGCYGNGEIALLCH